MQNYQEQVLAVLREWAVLDQMPEWQPLGAYTKFHGLMPMDLKRRQKMPTMAYQTWAEHIKGDSPELAAILLA